MERNKDPIRNMDQAQRALLRIHAIAKTLRLTAAEYREMAKVDVLDRIDTTAQSGQQLLAYAEGALDAHLALTVRLCCEFVYRLAAHEGADGIRVYGLTAHGPHEHYSKIPIEERKTALCCYVWLGSEGLAVFTVPVPERGLSDV